MADATDLGEAAVPTNAPGASMATVRQGEHDDHGRASCAIIRALDNGGSKGLKPRDLPTAVLSMPMTVGGVQISVRGIDIDLREAMLLQRHVLRPKVEVLLGYIKNLGDPHALHVQSAIARHIRSSMHLESQALSMADTLALVTTGSDATSDEAKLVTNMFNLMSTEYAGLRPLETVTFSVDKLRGWHETMFVNVEDFKDKHIGQIRNRGARTDARLFPSRSIVEDELPTLCAIVTDFCSRWKNSQPADEVEAVLQIFALATFMQFHFLDLHPFADGNGRMCRYLCKYILESCLPLPFPMYDSRDDYLAALRAGDNAVDNGPAVYAPAELLKLTIDSAVAFYAELASVVVCPFLRSSIFSGITLAAESRGLVLTDGDLEILETTFAPLGISESATVQLSIGDVKVEKTRVPLHLTLGDTSHASVPAK
jgi:fido (protein-threonine AMPylation protein)